MFGSGLQLDAEYVVEVVDADPGAFELDADRLAVVAVVVPFAFLVDDGVTAFEGDLQSGCVVHNNAPFGYEKTHSLLGGFKLTFLIVLVSW